MLERPLHALKENGGGPANDPPPLQQIIEALQLLR